MSLTTWLQAWVARHPLREPADCDRARFTTEVMARINALAPAPRPVPSLVPSPQWTLWPRLAMALATAAAGVLLAVGTARHLNRPLAQHAPRDGRAGVQFVLAENTASDEEWLQETLQLLEQLEEDISEDPSETASDGSDADWLDELQLLDEDELST